ncbi:clostripain-related cysteine peptidase [Oribacterium sp. P6A1]|uniref:clostripain-related cysteine peptidase n=1 Tax=Oribacterium sp. P6A1 TaxID=1410612 RepID=UPI0005695DED|nr:clostripain-related cysteine peptidase [Oribacterium sp. P6A1]
MMKKLREAGLIMFTASALLFSGCTRSDEITPHSSEETQESVSRGLAGKKGSDGSTDDKKLKLSDREFQVYDGHLDTVVLIYMVGSNLESENNLGTTDLHEIGEAIKAAGAKDTGVKILVETGGSKKWADDFDIDPEKLQRFEILADELSLKEELELANMSKPETLADFLNWGVNAYPADRYDLILWNHGGGSILGFGADEQFSGYMMRLQNLKKAFEAVDCHFDFVGFDACLMGTVETAYMLSPFADYLIASEEMEPGNGWYYTNWIKMLLEDPKSSPEKLGKQIIDDFASSNEKSGDNYTLSLMDLKKTGKVYEALIDFARNSEISVVKDQEYSSIAKARSDARSFGDRNYEQMDIIDFIEKTSVEGNDELKKAISEAVIYQKSNMKGANGMAMYYPNRSIEKFDQMIGLFDALQFDPAYKESLSGLCTIMAQADIETREGNGYTKKEWYRNDIANQYKEETDTKIPKLIPYREMDGDYVIDITPEQLDIMTYGALEVWLDTGEGYMEMGMNIWGDDKDEDNIVAGFDNAWVTLDDVFVPFYMQDLGMRTDGSAYEYGYVPAILNDKDYIYIRVEFIQPEHGEGWATVQGYWIVEEMDSEGGDGIRNLKQLKPGDTLDYVSFTYSYEGEELGPCQMGDRVTVPEEGLKVGYLIMDGAETIIRFILEDVYKNTYYTDWVHITP